MGRCLAPCDGSVDSTTYLATVEALRKALTEDPVQVVDTLSARMTTCSDQERYEEARLHRDRLAALVGSVARSQRLQALTRCREVVAARREEDGRWAVHAVRHGRLVAAGAIPRDVDARTYVAQLVASAETVSPGSGPTPAATAEEVCEVLAALAPDDPFWILDGGPLPPSLPSTVLAVTGGRPRILRAGAVPADELRQVVDEIDEPG